MPRNRSSDARRQMRRELEASAIKVSHRPHRAYCEGADKECYSSKHDVRQAHVQYKDVRAYRCSHDRSHFHATTDWKSKR